MTQRKRILIDDLLQVSVGYLVECEVLLVCVSVCRVGCLPAYQLSLLLLTATFFTTSGVVGLTQRASPASCPLTSVTSPLVSQIAAYYMDTSVLFFLKLFSI